MTNIQRHNNRKPKKTRQDKHDERLHRGNKQVAQDRMNKYQDDHYKLDWFIPQGHQCDIEDSFIERTFTIVDAPSGCGKTSMALWLALHNLKEGNFKRLIFCKNPTEVGDDQIGFLSGSEQDKLVAHYETTKFIFKEFMTPNKLENDLANNKIRLVIPNFLLGATLDYSVVILDESQLMSPETMKLLLERCGLNSKYLVLGDSRQRYSVKKRADGFKDFIERTTGLYNGERTPKYDHVGYVRMTTDENQRSDGSKFITKLYEGDL